MCTYMYLQVDKNTNKYKKNISYTKLSIRKFFDSIVFYISKKKQKKKTIKLVNGKVLGKYS